MVQKPNIPTVFVIFGASGDLIEKKIVPALYHLYQINKLPQFFKIIGVSRRSWGDSQFNHHIKKIIEREDEIFLRYFSYQQGNFNDKKTYEVLAKTLGRVDDEWKVCSNKLFYLAVPPQYYKGMFHRLKDSGLTIPCGPEEGWTRVIVEKPFGRDLQTAQELDDLLAELFREEQIYRIDHYLAKEMLQNILSFRFSNNLLEESWNNRFIEKIEIRLWEKIGVEKRGQFYDGVGAFRDVGQNHLLQMLALVTMEMPKSLDADLVRKLRGDILTTLKQQNPMEIKLNTFQAQYVGYQTIAGVRNNSKTETYFKIKAYLASLRWRGVPIYLESGKRLKEQVKEIKVTFKHPHPCLCPPGAAHYNNVITFKLEPEESIQIDFLAKKPGLTMEIEDRSLDFFYRKTAGRRQYVEEYEKLLVDCIEGNQLLFVSTSEVRAMWQFTDPIVEAWNKKSVSLYRYKPETDAIVKQADRFFRQTELPSQSALFSNKKQIGIVGLGKIGANIARNLLIHGWRVVGYNRTSSDTKELTKEGITGAYSFSELVEKLSSPRVIWLSLPAGQVIDATLFGKDGLSGYLQKGDIVIDAGNSYYKDTVRRSRILAKKGISFIDIGLSGGMEGARIGACLMVGGDKKTFELLYPLLSDLSVPEGMQFFEGTGAGHFVKMVHNGIEYGMMQTLAEGFSIMKKASYKLNLENVAEVYNHGSIIESRLMGWLDEAFEIYGNDLKDISGKVAHTGEGEWTIKTAKILKVKTKVIEDALQFRIESEKKPSYTGKILTALRNRFGGHAIK